MTNMINAKPLFGLHPNGSIFDYTTNQGHQVKPGATLKNQHGLWNVPELARLIKSGQSILGALLEAPGQGIVGAGTDKVEKAKADFLAHTPAVTGGSLKKAPTGMTPAPAAAPAASAPAPAKKKGPSGMAPKSGAA